MHPVSIIAAFILVGAIACPLIEMKFAKTHCKKCGSLFSGNELRKSNGTYHYRKCSKCGNEWTLEERYG